MIDKKPLSGPKHRRATAVSLIAMVVLGAAAVFSYFFLDRCVISWLSHRPSLPRNVWLDTLSQMGKASMLVWLSLCWIWVTGRLRPAVIVLVALAIIAAFVFSLKVTVQRPRPQDIVKLHSRAKDRNDFIRSWSFPSGDTADIFAAATVLAGFIAWPLAVVIFAAGWGIGLLRVAVLAHYPSDVCAGAAVGIFCGWLALQITRHRLEPRRFNRWRTVAFSGVIVMPLAVGLFQTTDKLLVFLETASVLFAGIYLIANAGNWFKLLRQRKIGGC
jgi:membrane-associated phospholipid phosphatase